MFSLLTGLAFAQAFTVTPPAVRQGETIHIRAQVSATEARMGDRVVKLFADTDGTRLGLMPVPLEQAPGAYRIDLLGDGGKVLQTVAVTVREGGYPEQNIVIGKATAELKPAPGEMEAVEALRNTVSDTRYWTEPFASPVPGCMTSLFGVKRLHNGKPTGNYHRGVDQRGAEGTRIRAIAGGVVRLVRPFRVHGNIVGIDHGQGLTSMYLHMSKFAVKEGMQVRQGDVLGYVGSTGRANGPHLHWAMHVNGVAVSPLQWVTLQACQAPALKRASPKPKRRTRSL